MNRARSSRSAGTVRPGRVLPRAAAVGSAGAIVLAGAWGADPVGTMHAYLTAWVFGVGIALGALALVMIGHVTGARWLVVIRRLAETVAATLPLFALLVVPILLDLDALYVWARPTSELEPELAAELAHKGAWLDEPFFTARTVVYLLLWSGMALALWRWSVRSDREAARARAGGRPAKAPVALSAVGLPVYGFTVTFAAFDWVMSLDPGWHSTVFGIYWFAGSFLAALALLVVLAAVMERAGHLRGRMAASHYHALGRLMLTFVIFWAYIAYSQGFLIWIADLPGEVGWVLARWEHGWAIFLVVLAVGHFGLPLLALLSRGLKRQSRWLCAVAVWLVLVHWVDVFWLVQPALGGRGNLPLWQHVPALAAVGGLATAWGAWRLRGHAPLPVGDPRLPASLAYQSR